MLEGIIRATLAAVVIVAMSGSVSGAQFPPERATNLTVLPNSIPMDSLVNMMGAFTRALGVRCSHCHVQKEGQAFEQMDFSLDDNPRKNTARAMYSMRSTLK